MERREAYERRIWRLAALLTDDVTKADDVLAQVLRTRPDIERVQDSRIDRMTVQAARRTHESNPGDGHGPDGVCARATITGPVAELWSLSRTELAPQGREAWLFRDVEQMSDIPAARAMDCSRTALEEVHRTPAERLLREKTDSSIEGGYDAALASLRAGLDALDPSEGIARVAHVRAAALRRRRIWTAVAFAGLLAFFGVMIFVLIDLLGWNERNEALKRTFERYSNPAPAPATAPASPSDTPDGAPPASER